MIASSCFYVGSAHASAPESSEVDHASLDESRLLCLQSNVDNLLNLDRKWPNRAPSPQRGLVGAHPIGRYISEVKWLRAVSVVAVLSPVWSATSEAARAKELPAAEHSALASDYRAASADADRQSENLRLVHVEIEKARAGIKSANEMITRGKLHIFAGEKLRSKARELRAKKHEREANRLAIEGAKLLDAGAREVTDGSQQIKQLEEHLDRLLERSRELWAQMTEARQRARRAEAKL
jgi:hypothetical protein